MKHLLSLTEKANTRSIIMKWINKTTRCNKNRTIGSITMGEILDLNEKIRDEIMEKIGDLLD